MHVYVCMCVYKAIWILMWLFLGSGIISNLLSLFFKFFPFLIWNYFIIRKKIICYNNCYNSGTHFKGANTPDPWRRDEGRLAERVKPWAVSWRMMKNYSGIDESQEGAGIVEPRKESLLDWNMKVSPWEGQGTTESLEGWRAV